MPLPIYLRGQLALTQAQGEYVRVAYKDAGLFYSAHHYARGVSCSAVTIGYCEQGTLTACVSFGTPCSVLTGKKASRSFNGSLVPPPARYQCLDSFLRRSRTTSHTENTRASPPCVRCCRLPTSTRGIMVACIKRCRGSTVEHLKQQCLHTETVRGGCAIAGSAVSTSTRGTHKSEGGPPSESTTQSTVTLSY